MQLETSPSAVPTHPARFVFGGVAFDVSTAPGLTWSLDADHALFRAAFDTTPAALSVRIAVTPAPELETEFGREIHVSWDRDAGSVRASRSRAEVRQLGPRSFAASAVVSPSAQGCQSLCTALAGALIDRVGGVVMHASAIEVAGGALVFVGPSGAGKTTVANHCRGALAFAKDRVAAYPTPVGWHVAPMAGGDDVLLPQSSQRVLPLLGVLRVVKSDDPSIEDANLSRGVHLLRESVQATDRSVAAERDLLDRLVTMCAEVRVATIRNVLGHTVLPRLLAWSRS